MNIIGRGAGAAALRERLAGVVGPDVRWGRNGVNGLEQLVRFHEAGIPAPHATNEIRAAHGWLQVGIETWGRKLHHARGNDIVHCGHRRFWDRDFWVQVIPNVQFELRVHVWDGKAFRTGVKVRTGNPVNPRSRIAGLPVRNDRNGWHLKYTQEALNVVPEAQRKATREVAKAAVAAVGYLYGAVDCYITADGVVGVFEVNTAPALGDRTLDAYVEQLSAWAQRQQV